MTAGLDHFTLSAFSVRSQNVWSLRLEWFHKITAWRSKMAVLGGRQIPLYYLQSRTYSLLFIYIHARLSMASMAAIPTASQTNKWYHSSNRGPIGDSQLQPSRQKPLSCSVCRQRKVNCNRNYSCACCRLLAFQLSAIHFGESANRGNRSHSMQK
jgi:hypothetical protein